MVGGMSLKHQNSKLESKGVEVLYVCLNVGLGTFRPVAVEKVEEHEMHSEFYTMSSEVAEILNNTKNSGGRIIAVGTTSTRTLETIYSFLSCNNLHRRIILIAKFLLFSNTIFSFSFISLFYNSSFLIPHFSFLIPHYSLCS